MKPVQNKSVCASLNCTICLQKVFSPDALQVLYARWSRI